MAERIGITMRVVEAAGYVEPRDALAQDWARWLAAALPGVSWLPVPNLGAAVVDYAADWGLDGFVLSGGNDLGQCPLRDATELALLDHAIATSRPVLGVCRGLQLLNHHGGGEAVACEGGLHAGAPHQVGLDLQAIGLEGATALEVNSFHDFAVPGHGLAPTLEPWAVSVEGYVEAVRHREAPIHAVQWHPERAAGPEQAELDARLMRVVFRQESRTCERSF